MAQSSAMHDVITALVAGMRGVSGYRSPWQDAAGVAVYDTVEVLLAAEHVEQLLVVGWPGEAQGPTGEASDAAQAIATLGTQRHRDEEGRIQCLALVQSGDTDVEAGRVTALRGQLFAILDGVDTYLRGHGALGLVPTYRHLEARFGQLSGLRPYVARGLVMEALFTVEYDARI